jgi:hypothetical protein
MKRLIVRFEALYMKPERVVPAIQTFPGSLAESLLHELLLIRDNKTLQVPTLMYRCDYHEHDETAPKGPECLNSPEFIQQQNKTPSK